MDKTRNVIFHSGNGDRKNIQSDRILWWMQKYKNSIYVPFVNNIHVV